MIQEFLKFISFYIHGLGSWTYFFVFISVIFETLIGIGFIFPGTTIIVFISFFSAQSGINPYIIFLYAFFGTLIGNLIDYYFGYKYFEKISNKISPFISKNTLEKTQKIISNNPIKSIVLGRLTHGLKEIIPFLSGVIGVRFYKFLIYSSIGTIIWGSVFIGIPYIFSYSLTVAQIWLDRISFFVLILFLIGIFFSFLKYLLSKYGKTILDLFFKLILVFKEFLLSKEIIQNFLNSYPKTCIFIFNRFKKNEFSGIPLTILIILLLYIISSFFGLIKNIILTDLIIGYDLRIYWFFFSLKNDFLVQIFTWINYFGRGYIILGFVFFMTIYLFLINKKNEVFALIISVFGSLGLDYFLKIIFEHSKIQNLIYMEKSFSFPSSSASITMLFYGFLFWLLIRKTKIWKTKINYFFSILIIVFLVGFSSIYLGINYFSYVFGGYLIGIIWLLFAIGFTEFLNIKHKITHQTQKFQNQNLIRYFFIFLIFIFYITFNLFFPYNNQIILPKILKTTNILKIDDIFKNSDLLKYSQNFAGKPAENINFIFLAKSDNDLKNVFNAAEWETADKLNYNSLKKISNNLLFQKPYSKAPIIPIFWNNKTQDFSFQKLPDDKNIRFRHHIRIWKTTFKYGDYFGYVGVGVFDDGLKWHITHKIDPDIDKEVEFIFSDIKKTNLLDKFSKINLVKPYSGKNVFGDKFFTSGNAYLVTIK